MCLHEYVGQYYTSYKKPQSLERAEHCIKGVFQKLTASVCIVQFFEDTKLFLIKGNRDRVKGIHWLDLPFTIILYFYAHFSVFQAIEFTNM